MNTEEWWRYFNRTQTIWFWAIPKRIYHLLSFPKWAKYARRVIFFSSLFAIDEYTDLHHIRHQLWQRFIFVHHSTLPPFIVIYDLTSALLEVVVYHFSLFTVLQNHIVSKLIMWFLIVAMCLYSRARHRPTQWFSQFVRKTSKASRDELS